MESINPVQERRPTLVIAEFPSDEDAARAVAALGDQRAFIVAPKDPMAARKLEPDQRGIWRTLLASHVVLGGAGTLLGLLVGWMLIRQWPAAAASPGYMLLFAAGLGAMLGMLIAGLVSLRPDRIVLIRRAHAALKRGNWIVAVHPAGAQAADAAMQVLRGLGTDPKRSL